MLRPLGTLGERARAGGGGQRKRRKRKRTNYFTVYIALFYMRDYIFSLFTLGQGRESETQDVGLFVT